MRAKAPAMGGCISLLQCWDRISNEQSGLNSLLQAHVTRTQHPIGHGGFHTGNLRIFGPMASEHSVENFWYVYDCGSEDNAAFTLELAAHRRQSKGRTDILFVSHLHSDHINGIERLLVMAPAKTVVVPYLDILERLIFLLGDIERGRASSSAREYFEDPMGWWIRRGAGRVIFLEPGGNDGEGPGDFPEPDAPVDGGDGEEEFDKLGKNPAARIVDRLVRPRRESAGGTSTSGRDDSKGRALRVGSGSHFSFCWQPHPRAKARSGDWILLPYVHPLDTSTRTAFRKAVNTMLSIGLHNRKQLGSRLSEFLSDFDKTKRLVDLYGDHFGRGHNAVSMSLYSGPSSMLGERDNASRHWNQEWQATDTDLSYVEEYLNGGRAVGWLATGDSELKQSHRREPWQTFYKPFSSQISILNLPHHGSRRNFHEDILDFDALSLAVVTTVPSRRRISKLRETLDLVEAVGKTSHIVDSLPYNRLQISCSRTLHL